MRLDDPRLALGFGLSGAACLVIPLLAGMLTGHAAGGATVGLGAWLVAARANADPAGVRTPYLLGAVVSVGVGTSLGVLLAGHSWVMVVVASVLAGVGGLIRPVGVTPALTLLLTASNALPLDPVPHTALQLLGGLLSSVLLTLPWPWRRTRPLVTTLSEAADRLADLVEAAADPDLAPEEWDRLRRRAVGALNEVRTARTRRRWQRSAAADEVATALRRVFHEIVALRGLMATLHRRAPEACGAIGLRDLVDSIARALRAYLAQCPPAGQERIVDFAGRVDALREEAGGGERTMVVLVLLRQIAHASGRVREALDGSGDAARLLCSRGLTLPPLPPLPGTEAASGVGFDDPRVRHALRVVLGTAFASLVIVLYRPAFPHWLVIAVLVTIQPTYGETRAKVWARVGGSTVGGVVSAVILHMAPGHWPLLVLIGVSAALAFGLASTHHAYWATFMTMCVLLLLDFQVPQTAGVAESRVVLTILGGLIAIACTRLLWPRGETVRLADRTARLLTSHAAAARALAQLSRGKTTAARAEERISKAGVDAEMLSGSLRYVAQEPGGAAHGDLERAVDAAQRVRDDLLTLTSVLRDEPGRCGPVAEVLDAVGERLEAAGEAVEGGEPFDVTGEVDRRLADDAAWLGELAERHLADLDDDRGATRTKVRRSLLQTAAVDQALRSLHDHALGLARAATTAFGRT
ncbi:FUSC family protein [Microbispora sp. ATCC PTA-5024]|uniref:FUSC family protein n=1 Tax=Microbispora sp. ATCC PTA-5024 TaxID=316330 RepID=UPI0003DCAC18|nr:FUSC family protein [Microbispora sp. ATCC PTA-5024]ETK34437.1 hypothetical protein MPTA5024_19180 [Microbispora sp. ATCC PTA-5024]